MKLEFNEEEEETKDEDFEQQQQNMYNHNIPQDDFDYDEDIKCQQEQREVEMRKLRMRKMPKMPKQKVFTAVVMVIAGIILAGLSFYDEILTKGARIGMFIFGLFVEVPGAYYSYFLFKAYNAQNPEERRKYLKEVS